MQEFLDSLEPKLLAKTLRTIDFFVIGKKAILTNGFKKKLRRHHQQKRNWQKNKADYERRYSNK